MSLDVQEKINELYSNEGNEILGKARMEVLEGGRLASENLSDKAGIPIDRFSYGPDGVFLMSEPENENYLRIDIDNVIYRIPDLFRGGTLGVYGETEDGSKLIGMKPKYVEGPYNEKKVEEYKQLVMFIDSIIENMDPDNSKREFLEDYRNIAVEEIRLMKNPKRTAQYIATHESTHDALAAIGVAKKIDTGTNEALTEINTRDALGYTILGPDAEYTKNMERTKERLGGREGAYQFVKSLTA